MGPVPGITLNNGTVIPQLGFGVWQVPDDESTKAVGHALQAGYRSIDTAAIYGNERGVGRAIESSGLERDELFITTKLWNADQGYDATLRAFDESLDRLGLDHVDLYLIHWPLPKRDNYVATWRAFRALQDDGRARAIGVSNFQPAHLQRLIDETGVTPAVNQIELHPYLQQADLRAFHAQHGIATEAWSPLAQGSLLAEDTVTSLASKYGKTPAQIVLRWHLTLRNIVIPKSVTPSRIQQNIDVFDFELADDDLAAISDLDSSEGRVGPHPDTLDAV